MQKIMFSDKYLLTKAVIECRKMQTRRLIKCRKTFKGEWVAGFNIHIRPSDKKVVGLPCMYDADEREFEGGEILPKYKIGEVVAVAQSYKDAGFRPDKILYRSIPRTDGYKQETAASQKGWSNKRFVAANLMPHQIRITDVRIEKLQDISDEDCLKEGIIKKWHAPACKNYYYVPGIEVKSVKDVYDTPQEAFAHLINKVSRKDVWQENPYVFVYDFELIK